MADKNSGSSEDEVKKAAKPLDDQDIKVTYTQWVVGARKGVPLGIFSGVCCPVLLILTLFL